MRSVEECFAEEGTIEWEYCEGGEKNLSDWRCSEYDDYDDPELAETEFEQSGCYSWSRTCLSG